jgi:hypothetical protein
MQLAKKLLLFAVICFLPFTFFYLVSTGEHHFEILPFLGPEKEGKNFRFDEPELYSVSGEKINDSLKGKTLIINVLNPNYPNQSGIYMGAFKQIVLAEIMSNKKYSNVVVLSEIHEADSAQLQMLYDKYYIPGKWFICKKPEKSFYDVDNGDGNLLTIKDPKFKDRKFYERLVLLVDKDRHWRGVQDLTEGIKSKTFVDELKLLMKEYYKDYGAY